jgi:hypothetical protein
MTSSIAAADSCHVHFSSPLAASDQAQGAGYSKSEVETDAVDLGLETDAAALKLETDATPLEVETNTAILDLEMETDAA